MTEQRKSRKSSGCLIQEKITFPQDKVIECRFCPNHTAMTGDLAKTCAFTTK